MSADKIVLHNDLQELRRMSQWLQTRAVANGIAGNLVHRLDIVANEAMTNIISYAYADAARHEIEMELTKTAAGASITIRDDGIPYNPLEVPEHVVPARLADAAIGGLGVHLIRRLASRCDYRREGGCNVLSIEAARELQTGNA